MAEKFKWKLVSDDENNPVKAISTGNVSKSVIINGDSVGDIDNEELNINTSEIVNHEIEKLKKRIEDLYNLFGDYKKDKYVPINYAVAIFGLSFFFFLFAVFLNKHLGFGISGDSIVLAFVGIAATFVVVSNYAQVKDIEGKFESKVKDVERKFDERVEESKKYTNIEVEKFEKIILENTELIDKKFKDLDLRLLRYGNIPFEIERIEFHSLSILDKKLVRIDQCTYGYNEIKFNIISNHNRKIEIILPHGYHSTEFFNNDYSYVSINGENYNSDSFPALINVLYSFGEPVCC